MPIVRRALFVSIALALSVLAIPAWATQQSPAPQAAATIQGELVGVDTDAQTLTIRDSSGEELEFRYDSETEVTGAQEGVAGLATMSGSQVTIRYVMKDQEKTATRIEVHARK
jgi:hypothetical protein